MPRPDPLTDEEIELLRRRVLAGHFASLDEALAEAWAVRGHDYEDPEGLSPAEIARLCDAGTAERESIPAEQVFDEIFSELTAMAAAKRA